MYLRLTIFSLTIALAVGLMGVLGYLSLERWQQGLTGQRLGEFANVASQIQMDIKKKLDAFVQLEQSRPYTDYQPYSMPDLPGNELVQQVAVVRSPLSGRLDHGLAYGHFQVQPDGKIVTPNDHLLATLQAIDPGQARIVSELHRIKAQVASQLLPLLRPSSIPVQTAFQQTDQEVPRPSGKAGVDRVRQLPIDSLNQAPQEVKVVQEDRALVLANIAMPAVPQGQAMEPNAAVAQGPPVFQELGRRLQEIQSYRALSQTARRASTGYQAVQAEVEKVAVRMDPLVPIVLEDQQHNSGILQGQVYMVRHVQVEDLHLFQGLLVDPNRLLSEVRDSTNRLIRKDMGFALSASTDPAACYVAVLDFGFGRIVLNLIDKDPALVQRTAKWLSKWYFGTMGLVTIALGVGLASLWHGVWQQVKLARQKDNFIWAVSHELRAPIAAIRMCAEMLEKGWVASEDKRNRYYHNIRQEGQRLSRLIENVLDFSRIQQGRHRFNLSNADLNHLVTEVVDMVRPYAASHGFSIRTDLAELHPFAFDRDAVTQILVNLLDNAVKFAADSQDKTVTVRTGMRDRYAVIEVEDRGPGIPASQRQNVFKEFYRLQCESTRQSPGVGLGLALAQRFALAHGGFIRISEARPQGAVFTVGLRASNG